jgi:cyclopropane-fatty-acyl-phospholipid synthase
VCFYDEIVLAVNCHQVYPLLVNTNLNSKEIEYAYKNFKSTENKLVIHKDTSVMAKNRAFWCSWNTEVCNTGEKPVTSYWFQNLQHIKHNNDLFLTLNPNKQLSNVIQEYTMFHPIFSSVVEQYKAQIRGDKMQGVNNVWFTGAYLYNGFHEDGVVSALNVVQRILKKHSLINSYHIKNMGSGILWSLVNMVNNFFCKIIVYVLKRLIKHGSINIYYNNLVYSIINETNKKTNYDNNMNMNEEPIKPIDIYVNSAYFFYLVIMKQDLGFAESYIKQYFETDRLYDLLKLFVINKATDNAIYNILPFTYIGRVFDLISHKMKFNSIEHSRENIHKHYDLSNELYVRFLDKSMTYSSALFKNGLKPTVENLYEAQQNKYNRITNKLRMNEKENPSILEIGCGWGGYAKSLINMFETKDFSYIGITISEEQYKYCVDLFKTDARINIVLIDYRLIQGHYDYVVSIEMIEAVGYEYFDSYFATINKRLKSNGRAMIQAITIPDNRYEKYKTDVDFIQKYVFPGGFLPSIGEMCKYGIKYNLVMTDINNFGIDYKHTLLLWLEKFKKNYEEIQTFGFDEYFYYLWEYYLVYCAVGFDNGMINLNQVMFTKYE